MKRISFKAVLAIALTCLVSYVNANNVRISGTAVSGSNITFNIAWDNSWYANVAPSNNDAIWIFVKYQDCATNLWAHASLSTVAADDSAGAPLTVETVADGKGVFVRRSSFGGGNIANTFVRLKMTIPVGTYNYKVFGIEMAKILQDTFQIGDGTSAGSFNSITITANSQSSGVAGSTLSPNSFTIPSTYPMGYNSFYCMKYEISQQQYVDFLNTLQYVQQQSRTAIAPNSVAGTLAIGTRANWNGIVIQTPGSNGAIPAVYANDYNAGGYNNTDDAQNKACGYLSWADVSALLDWAALRPMTELEYEKICRGPEPRVASDYAWGSATYTIINSVTNAYTATEMPFNVVNGPLVCYGALPGPLRCGFAASGSSGRISSGAAYYGPMEMSGNVTEMVVNTTTPNGVLFDGTLGDGTLTASGFADVSTWPTPTTGTGIGFRGGSVNYYYNECNISHRVYINTIPNSRTLYYGGRGVR